MTKTSVFLNRIVDLLFPPRCLFCDAVLPLGQNCGYCEEEALKLRLAGSERKDYLRAERNLDFVDTAISSYRYNGAAAEVVQRLKFSKRNDLAPLMAKIMAADAKAEIAAADNWVVVGVPSYKNAAAHSGLLARQLAKQLGLAYSEKLLVKTRQTEKQHNLSAESRAENLRGSFAVDNANLVREKRVVVCDDVMTSGNTLNECARALKQAGAVYVLGVCFTATALDSSQKAVP